MRFDCCSVPQGVPSATRVVRCVATRSAPAELVHPVLVVHRPVDGARAEVRRGVGVAQVEGVDVGGVALAELGPPPPVRARDVEGVLRGVDRARLGERGVPALQRVGGEVDRRHDEQPGPGGRRAEREVAAGVGDGRAASAGDADLTLAEPVVERAAADQRLVGRLQRIEGLVPLVGARARGEVGPVAHAVGEGEGVGHHQPDALVDAPGRLVRARQENLRGDLRVRHVAHVHRGDLGDVARPVAAERRDAHRRPGRRGADRMRCPRWPAGRRRC